MVDGKFFKQYTFYKDGEIQFIGAGNDALTKISASDGRVVAESLGTRGLNLRAYNPLSSTWSDNGVNLAVNIDQAIFTQSRQLRISDVISVLMAQSTKLMEIVNANQKEVNRLKKESDQLQTHMDNATDQIDA